MERTFFVMLLDGFLCVCAIDAIGFCGLCGCARWKEWIQVYSTYWRSKYKTHAFKYKIKP